MILVLEIMMRDIARWFVIDALADALDLISSSLFFALNNPTVFRDPDGNCPQVDCN